MQGNVQRIPRPADRALQTVAYETRIGRPIQVISMETEDYDLERPLYFAPGQTLFHIEDQARDIYEILSGAVRCSRFTLDGRRHIYRFAEEGGMLGLGIEPQHTYTAEAMTEVVVRRYRQDRITQELVRDSGLQERMFDALNQELAAVRRHVFLLSLMTAAEKVASFLLDLVERAPEAARTIYLPASRADIADYLGTTVETVSRQLSALKRRRVITLPSPKAVRILDHGRLQAIALAA